MHAQNTPTSTQEAPGRAGGSTQISNDLKAKKVNLWGMEYEIPSHMSLPGMVEVWKNQSDSFEALARDIVENNPRFAWEIVYLWLDKHHRLMIDDPAYELGG